MTHITIESPAFENNSRIPPKYTSDAEDQSPPLSWHDLPQDTKELALIVDDPDAPQAKPWVHWVLYNIPAATTDLAPDTGADGDGMAQGKNSWGSSGYRGPQPPKGHGTHHYHFTLYALDAPLSAGPGLTKEALLKKMEGHIIGNAELVGTYSR